MFSWRGKIQATYWFRKISFQKWRDFSTGEVSETNTQHTECHWVVLTLLLSWWPWPTRSLGRPHVEIHSRNRFVPLGVPVDSAKRHRLTDWPRLPFVTLYQFITLMQGAVIAENYNVLLIWCLIYKRSIGHDMVWQTLSFSGSSHVLKPAHFINHVSPQSSPSKLTSIYFLLIFSFFVFILVRLMTALNNGIGYILFLSGLMYPEPVSCGHQQGTVDTSTLRPRTKHERSPRNTSKDTRISDRNRMWWKWTLYLLEGDLTERYMTIPATPAAAMTKISKSHAPDTAASNDGLL